MDCRKERLSTLVKEARGQNSLRELSRRLGLSVGTVENWEKGRALPDLDNLFKLAAYIGWSPDRLLLYLEDGTLPDPNTPEQLATRIRNMPNSEFALVARAVVDRLAAS